MNKIVILAAGKGKRMNLNRPKVLSPLAGKPIIEHLLKAIMESGVDDRPIIVVSPGNKDVIKNALSSYNLEYAVQKEQLGTAHAVLCAKELVGAGIKNVVVLNGDHPLFKSETIKKLSQDSEKIITILTAAVTGFNDWQKSFYQWGRIVRGRSGEIKGIVEFRDADEKTKKIKEVNPAAYRFNGKWLWKNIERIKNNNAQKEYYLTDLVELAFNDGAEVDSILIKPEEALGINTPAELAVAETLL